MAFDADCSALPMSAALLLDRHDLVSGWVAAKTGYLPGGKYWAVGLIESDGFTQRIVAGCVFDNWRGHDITGHIACDVPVTRPFLHAIHDLPYRVLGVRRITATVRADNAASMEFLRRVGFKHEGTIRAGYPDGSDRFIFGQLKENAKWLASR